ncbi:Dof-type zinc finger DNA-binding family protein [Perilla frutescens var. frutescens]|nr:Dof-type zinc finger DNA-binding family protein [Perilla frutescens var. frutescens]
MINNSGRYRNLKVEFEGGGERKGKVVGTEVVGSLGDGGLTRQRWWQTGNGGA